MKAKQKFSIALEVLKNNIPLNILSGISGVSSPSLASYGKMLEQNGYMSFSPPPLDIAVSVLALSGKLNFVQVGANDGKEGDPVNHLIHRYASNAILIEPISDLIDRLKSSYSDYRGNLVIENCAVSNGCDEFRLWCLKQEHWELYVKNVGRHPTAISSFDPGPLTKKIANRMNVSLDHAKAMIELVVCPAYSLSNIIDCHALGHVDVLQIDAEGYDFEVILSLGEVRPSIINFESVNLSVSDWAGWKRWANKNGYGFVQGRMDTLAIRNADFTFEY